MIEGLLEWLQLLNLKDLAAAPSASNIILVMYLLTIRKSWLFALAFFICEFSATSGYFGVFDSLSDELYGFSFFTTACFIWCVTIKSHINHTRNKSLAFSCSMMITLLIALALDSLYDAENQHFIYDSYASIIVCIHFCIILSLYDSRAFIENMVSQFYESMRNVFSHYSFKFICYTCRKSNQFNRA